MVAKKFIARVMEEFVGEYILNIAKEKINLAILRGKLNMDNVELDGSFIAQQILCRILGLPIDAFGCISCTAIKLKAIIPWGKLEKEPTRFELSGLYCVIVPIISSTAYRKYFQATFEDVIPISKPLRGSSSKSESTTTGGDGGGEGIQHKWKNTLRTRTKRSILARMERNYFAWRIPGEGPPRPEQVNAEKKRRSSHHSSRRSTSRHRYSSGDTVSGVSQASNYYEDETTMSFTTGGGGMDQSISSNRDNGSDEKDDSNNDNWMSRLSMKIFRNIEIRINEVHIRCEVCESGTYTNEPATKPQTSMDGGFSPSFSSTTSPTKSFKTDHHATTDHPTDPTTTTNEDDEPQSYAFGFTLDRLLYKSANSKWETGNNVNWDVDDDATSTASAAAANTSTPSPSSPSRQKKKSKKKSPTSSPIPIDDIKNSSSDSGGRAPSPNESSNTSSDAEKDNGIRYKVLQGETASIYWDDCPPVLISESRLLTGLAPPSNSSTNDSSPSKHYTSPSKQQQQLQQKQQSSTIIGHKLNKEKVNHRIRLAMEQMMKFQDPGSTIIDLLECRETPSATRMQRGNSTPPQKPHVYWARPTSIELRLTYTNIDKPGIPTICNAELVPCEMDATFRPHQLQQYRMLHNSMIAQQRLDTMLQQRPTRRPTEDPKAWWKYALSCVITQQNTKSWRDVRIISQYRPRYIQLVHDHVYHMRESSKGGGKLSRMEVEELQRMQDILPIEVSLAFHLIALRKVVRTKQIILREKEQRDAMSRSGSRRRRTAKSMSPSNRPGLGGVMNTPNSGVDEMSVITESSFLDDMSKPGQIYQKRQSQSGIPHRYHSQSPSSSTRRSGSKNRRRVATIPDGNDGSKGDNDSFSVNDIIQSLSSLEHENNSRTSTTPKSNSSSRSVSRGSTNGAPSPKSIGKGGSRSKHSASRGGLDTEENISPTNLNRPHQVSSMSPIPKVPARRSLSSTRDADCNDSDDLRPTNLSFGSPPDTDRINSVSRRVGPPPPERPYDSPPKSSRSRRTPKSQNRSNHVDDSVSLSNSISESMYSSRDRRSSSTSPVKSRTPRRHHGMKSSPMFDDNASIGLTVASQASLETPKRNLYLDSNSMKDDSMSMNQSVFSFESSSPYGSIRQDDDFNFDEITLSEDSGIIEEPMMRFALDLKQLTMRARLMDMSGEHPIVQGEMQTGGWVNNLDEDIKLQFDIQRIEVMDCRQMSKMFTFDRCTDFGNSLSFMSNIIEQDSKSSDALSVPILPQEHDGDILHGDVLPPPPNGIACRLSVLYGLTEFSLKISMNSATFFWNKECWNALLDSVTSNPTPELRSVLRSQLRNAATPLVHKTQIAFMSPRKFSVIMNIDSPKLWFPVSAMASDGALLLNGGNFKTTFYKPEVSTQTLWKVDVDGIKANFCRSHAGSSFSEDESGIFSNFSESSVGRMNIPIILPFNFNLIQERLGEGATTGRRQDSNISDYHSSEIAKPSSQMKMKLSKISLNLMDVEVLAKAIGKWYATRLNTLKKKCDTGQTPIPSATSSNDSDERINLHQPTHFETSLEVEGIEMKLEGQQPDDTSKQIKNSSYPGTMSMKRAYLIQIIGLHLKRERKMSKTSTHLLVRDTSITQMKKIFDREKLELHVFPSDESQHKVLSFACLPKESTQNADRVLFTPNRPVVTTPKRSATKGSESMSCLPATPFDPEIVNDHDSNNIKNVAFSGTMSHDILNHSDDVEAEINFLTIRITPISLQDCSEAVGRIMNSIEIMTKEMERRVHEAGRSSRNMEMNQTAKDSSLLLKVNFKEVGILSQWPAAIGLDSSIHSSSTDQPSHDETFKVQVLSNMLVMYQSIENPDASGSKTVHVSIDNLSLSLVPRFERVSTYDVFPILGPIASEFRLVYLTQKMGSTSSQDFSLDCDTIKCCLTLEDIQIVKSLVKSIRDYTKRIAPPGKQDLQTSGRQNPMIMEYQKKGSAIATSIRFEFQPFSFVLLRETKVGNVVSVVPLFDFHGEARGKLEGCASALTGEIPVRISANSFNNNEYEWENLIEPCSVHLDLEQLPNEMNIGLFLLGGLKVNLTSSMLMNITEFTSVVQKQQKYSESQSHGVVHTSSPLSSPRINSKSNGKELDSQCLSILNESGIDIILCPMGSIDRVKMADETNLSSNPASSIVRNGELISVEDVYFSSKTGGSFLHSYNGSNVALGISPGSENIVGKRHIIFNLQTNISDMKDLSILRLDPKKQLFESEKILNHIEPVVEWCMQNQRLRSAYPDASSMNSGCDFLSSSVWSPGNIVFQENVNHWLHPYEKSDVPEWSDMTCRLEMSRDRVMLPDDDWIWLNGWTVDVSGDYCHSTDSDGWDYSEDFESFSTDRRYYKQGDRCRRRRWTRTRMMKPHGFDDPCRPLSIVWQCSTDTNGNQMIKIASCLTLRNCTASKLTFFAFSPTWEEEQFITTVMPGETFVVPIHLASATYIRLARQKEVIAGKKLTGYSFSERMMILPTSFTSSSVLRRSIEEQPTHADDTFPNRHESHHFLVRLNCSQGVRKISVEPVLKIVNLLPCHLEYRLAEGANGSEIFAETEHLDILEARQIQVGEEKSSIGVCPRSRPMISFRVPGFKWSKWQCIVNRKCEPQTWKRKNDEEGQAYDHYHNGTKDEYKSLISMCKLVDGNDMLKLILAVEPGHCPVIRIYAQFWIVDKSGFGLKFCPSYNELLGTALSPHLHRRSYLPQNEANHEIVVKDMTLQGHEWTMGAHGMSLYFSKEQKMNVAIEQGNDIHQKRSKSEWSSTLDLSNIMPKTVFALNDRDKRSYELAYDVSSAPSIYSRTKIIRIIPRFEVVNLMEKGVYIAQEGSLDTHVYLPARSAIPFQNWSDRDQPHKVCLSVESGGHWSSGSIQLDKVGITSLRLPDLPLETSVVQAEIRLAARDHDTAVTVVLWDSHPLYLLRNKSSYTILCSQPLHEDLDEGDDKSFEDIIDCTPRPSPVTSTKVILNTNHVMGLPTPKRYGKKKKGKIPNENQVTSFITNGFECGVSNSDIYEDEELIENFVWHVSRGSEMCFGFDDPYKSHTLQWSCREAFDKTIETVSHVELDNVGSSNVLVLPSGKRVGCQVRAEDSTKVIEFVDIYSHNTEGDYLLSSLADKLEHHKNAIAQEDFEVLKYSSMQSLDSDDDTEFVNMKFRLNISSISISMIDNVNTENICRELLYLCGDNIMARLSLNRDGYQELEMRIMSVQVDNNIHRVHHPIMISHQLQDDEPFLHISAVGRLQPNSSTFVFRYAAIRFLSIDVSFDRRTVDTLEQYFRPLRDKKKSSAMDTETREMIIEMTSTIQSSHKSMMKQLLRKIDESEYSVSLGRTYVERLHLHPIRIYVTYTQEWDLVQSTNDSPVYLQFIRILPSVSKAPLIFTSFVVSHVFEAPGTLRGIIGAHYVSQLTKHVFSIIGSIAILNGPADFLTNVGTGVRDFFYEPINGLVHGPAQFMEGLETGSLSLVRGVFVGVVRGAANVTWAVNSNLAELTDDAFLGERQAYQRSMTDTLNKGNKQRTITDSLSVAGSSIALGIRSGAMGIVEQPFQSFAKSGPIGFVQGVGKAIVGAIIKPVVGVGDGALFLLNHVNDATSPEAFFPMVKLRLHRALPSKMPNQSSSLVPYDEEASEAQKIVTSNGTIDDNYIGHVKLKKYLIIASERSLRIIYEESGKEDELCLSWEEISHFKMLEGMLMQITAFSQTGLRSYAYKVDSADDFTKFHNFLLIQKLKMGNGSSRLTHGQDCIFASRKEKVFLKDIPCMKAHQERYTFGSINNKEVDYDDSAADELDVIELCFHHVKKLGSDQPNFFKLLDESAWSLIYSWSRFSSGLNPRRCVLAGIINGSGIDLQIKMTKLMEGASPCYHIPTREYDEAQGTLRPGAAIMFFSWGMVPSLLQEGGVSMQIETNGFVCTFKDRKFRSISSVPCPGYDVCFLEKSYDSSGWWAKYWMLVTRI